MPARNHNPRARTSRSRAKAGSKSQPRSRSNGRSSKIRYAVVGVGYIAQNAVLPAFAHAKRNSELVALVSGDPTKLAKLGRRYRVATYDYSDYRELVSSGDIDAVYIALPNSEHAEAAILAAEAGVHVLVEKPMAVTPGECEDMIKAAETGGVKLMVAYRLHFEKANLEAIRVVQSRQLGDLRYYDALFGMQVRDDDIRLREDLGGGPLFDLGIYCINAARYLFRDEPIEVFGCDSTSEDDRRFDEVPEMTSAVLRFADERVATFTCSFGSADVAWYQVVGAKGSLRLEHAFEYSEPMKLAVTVGDRTRNRDFPKRDQFAPELLYFSDCILKNRTPEPSGLEGLADVRIIDALRKSAYRRSWIRLGDFPDKRRRPTMEQEIHRPSVREPELVHARPAHLEN